MSKLDLKNNSIEEINKSIEELNRPIEVRNGLKSGLKDLYSNIHTTKNKKSKKDSEILYRLTSKIKYIKQYRIQTDMIVKCLCSLIYYTNSKQFFRLPDRFICRRLQTSRQVVYNIIHLLSICGIVAQTMEKGYILVKINWSLFRQKDKKTGKYKLTDPYIAHCLKKFNKADKDCLENVKDEFDSVFLKLFEHEYKNFKTNQTILEISMVYTKLLEHQYFSQTYLEDREAYGDNKAGLQYIQVPYILISYLTGLSQKEIEKHLYDLCKHTNYITFHERIYDTKITNKYGEIIALGDNYYNEYYIQFDLAENGNILLNEDHPIVNHESYIIFKEKFEMSLVGSGVLENIEQNEDLWEQLINKHLIKLKYIWQKNKIEKPDNEKTMTDALMERYGFLNEQEIDYLENLIYEKAGLIMPDISSIYDCRNIQNLMESTDKSMNYLSLELEGEDKKAYYDAESSIYKSIDGYTENKLINKPMILSVNPEQLKRRRKIQSPRYKLPVNATMKQCCNAFKCILYRFNKYINGQTNNSVDDTDVRKVDERYYVNLLKTVIAKIKNKMSLGIPLPDKYLNLQYMLDIDEEPITIN